jgi:hypothetical protein
MRSALLVLLALGLLAVAAPPAAADTFHCFNAVSQLQLVNCAVGCATHLVADVTGGGLGNPPCLIHA